MVLQFQVSSAFHSRLSFLTGCLLAWFSTPFTSHPTWRSNTSSLQNFIPPILKIFQTKLTCGQATAIRQRSSWIDPKLRHQFWTSSLKSRRKSAGSWGWAKLNSQRWWFLARTNTMSASKHKSGLFATIVSAQKISGISKWSYCVHSTLARLGQSANIQHI